MQRLKNIKQVFSFSNTLNLPEPRRCKQISKKCNIQKSCFDQTVFKKAQ